MLVNTYKSGIRTYYITKAAAQEIIAFILESRRIIFVWFPVFNSFPPRPSLDRVSLWIFTVSFRRVFTVIRSGFEVDLSRNVANRREFTTFSRNSMASRSLVAFSQWFEADSKWIWVETSRIAANSQRFRATVWLREVWSRFHSDSLRDSVMG